MMDLELNQPEMYESLTNGDCFAKPKFNFEEFQLQAEQSMLAPSDAFKPVSEDEEDGEF